MISFTGHSAPYRNREADMNRLEKQLTVVLILGAVPAMATDPTFAMAGERWGKPCASMSSRSLLGPAALSFADRNGVQYPSGPIKTVNLNPGQADSLDIIAVSLGVQLGHRMELRPVVTMGSSVDQPSACAANAEVFDTFIGRTWESATPVPVPF